MGERGVWEGFDEHLGRERETVKVGWMFVERFAWIFGRTMEGKHHREVERFSRVVADERSN